MFQLVVDRGYEKGRVFPLHEGDNLVGRSNACPIQLMASDVSRSHMVIRVNGSEAVAENVGGRTTLVDGAPLTEARPLKNGQRITLGNSTVLMLIPVVEPGPSEDLDELPTQPATAAAVAATPRAPARVEDVTIPEMDSHAGEPDTPPTPAEPASLSAAPAHDPVREFRQEMPEEPPKEPGKEPPEELAQQVADEHEAAEEVKKEPPACPPASNRPISSWKDESGVGSFLISRSGDEQPDKDDEPLSGFVDFSGQSEPGIGDSFDSPAVKAQAGSLLKKDGGFDSDSGMGPVSMIVDRSLVIPGGESRSDDSEGPRTRGLSREAMEYIRKQQLRKARVRMAVIVGGAVLLLALLGYLIVNI